MQPQSQQQQYPSGFAPNFQQVGYASAAAAPQEQFEQQYYTDYGFDKGPEQQGFVDAAINEVSPQWVHGNYHKGMKPSHFMLILGCLMLLLTVIMPIWESNRLMNDPTFVYFVGREYCLWIIFLCVCVIMLYASMIILLFGCAREEGKTQQNVMGIATTVITVLGLALLLVAQPLKNDSRTAYEELFFRCDSGPRSQRLMEYSTVLQTLRNRTDCASQVSVEQCEGYQESQPYTGFLKAIERTYKCSGFCWGGPDAAAVPAALLPLTAAGDGDEAAPAADADDDAAAPAEAEEGAAEVAEPDTEGAASLLVSAARPKSGITLTGALQKLASEKMQTSRANPERSSSRARRQQSDAFGNGLFLLATEQTLGRTSQDMTEYSVDAVSSEFQTASLVEGGEYPPTLFTDANYQTSCDGMAARGLRYEAMEAADMLYYEGVVLVFCAIAVMFLQVGGMCTNFSQLTGAFGKGVRFAPARQPYEQ